MFRLPNSRAKCRLEKVDDASKVLPPIGKQFGFCRRFTVCRSQERPDGETNGTPAAPTRAREKAPEAFQPALPYSQSPTIPYNPLQSPIKEAPHHSPGVRHFVGTSVQFRPFFRVFPDTRLESRRKPENHGPAAPCFSQISSVFANAQSHASTGPGRVRGFLPNTATCAIFCLSTLPASLPGAPRFRSRFASSPFFFLASCWGLLWAWGVCEMLATPSYLPSDTLVTGPA
ncbi:hypothetical protein F4823DRAFT_595970 [Ustulina deusta]|nr:hypothetical protein F4823DRAFT_595970 [Ustulina deusta]